MVVSVVIELEGAEESLPEGPRVLQERERSIMNIDTEVLPGRYESRTENLAIPISPR
jgi:hypothetical protein